MENVRQEQARVEKKRSREDEDEEDMMKSCGANGLLTMMPAVQGLSRRIAQTRKVQASTTLIASRNQCLRPMYCSQNRKGYPLG